MVGMVDYIQQIGHPAGPGVVNEVEANSRARRIVMRSNDYDHGAYAVGFGMSQVAGSSGATALAAQPLAGVQWITTKNYMVLKEVTAFISVFGSNVAAGVVRLSAWKATSFTRQFDTQTVAASTSTPLTGVFGTPLGSGQKLSNTMLNSDNSGLMMMHVSNLTVETIQAMVPGPSLVYANGASAGGYPVALQGAVYTLDTLPFGQIVTSAVPGGTPPRSFAAPMQTLFDSAIGPPLILENYSGLVFTLDGPSSVSAGLICTYAFNLQWDEVTTYPLGNNTN